MKTKWEEFIRDVVRDEMQRESMRVWVKNAVNGVKNKKALMLNGVGASGKTTLSKVIASLFNADEAIFCDSTDLDDSYFMYAVKDIGILIIDDILDKVSVSSVKCMIDDLPMLINNPRLSSVRDKNSTWPNILTISNSMDNHGLERRSTVIVMNMGYSSSVDSNLLSKLLMEKDFIRGWFLK